MAKHSFISWAVEVANTELSDKGQVNKLAKKAVKEGILGRDIVILEEGVPINDDVTKIVEFEIEDKGYSLRENVLAFVNAVKLEEPFIIQIEKKPSQKLYSIAKDICLLRHNDYYNGTVVYIRWSGYEIPEEDRAAAERHYRQQANNLQYPKDLAEDFVTDGMKKWTEKRKRFLGLKEALPFNSLVDRFYLGIHEYCYKKKYGFNDLPLRKCKLNTCRKPFFGRLRNQKFCCKRHGEIWHGKEAYKKKSGGK